MRTLKLITVIFSLISALLLIFFSQQQAILNLYVAFVLLVTATQGVVGLLSSGRFDKIIKDKHINFSILIIRIGLYIGLARAFILHGVEAETPHTLSIFGNVSSALLIIAGIYLLYACRIELMENVIGLVLLALSIAAVLAVGVLGFQETPFFTLDHTVPYLLATYMIWALATFLSQFGKKSLKSLE